MKRGSEMVLHLYKKNERKNAENNKLKSNKMRDDA